MIFCFYFFVFGDEFVLVEHQIGELVAEVEMHLRDHLLETLASLLALHTHDVDLVENDVEHVELDRVDGRMSRSRCGRATLMICMMIAMMIMMMTTTVMRMMRVRMVSVGGRGRR